MIRGVGPVAQPAEARPGLARRPGFPLPLRGALIPSKGEEYRACPRGTRGEGARLGRSRNAGLHRLQRRGDQRLERRYRRRAGWRRRHDQLGHRRRRAGTVGRPATSGPTARAPPGTCPLPAFPSTWFITDTAGSAEFQLEAQESALDEWVALGLEAYEASDWKEYPRDLWGGLITEERVYAIVPSPARRTRSRSRSRSRSRIGPRAAAEAARGYFHQGRLLR